MIAARRAVHRKTRCGRVSMGGLWLSVHRGWSERGLEPGELLDEGSIVLIGRRLRPGPGKLGDRLPSLLGRAAGVADQVGCMRQVGPVVARHAMEEDGLACGIG